MASATGPLGLAGNPEELVVLVQIHAEPNAVFLDLILAWLVVIVYDLVEDRHHSGSDWGASPAPVTCQRKACSRAHSGGRLTAPPNGATRLE
eukprot:CAMPEP_0180466710 /NCGR_PEP_ID=MMETSP1036_2-20121128/26617_1 /TAXON_ID=632150 /ORGANISM="Azadinium spinosum, Strain 3D9" /LENGTH=91 /DNA_ID=CAMNT_0022473635 /DNA_START=172 /DNA_END=445 /DNA_ORIENTATION=-